jgi:hypothetical protein
MFLANESRHKVMKVLELANAVCDVLQHEPLYIEVFSQAESRPALNDISYDVRCYLFTRRAGFSVHGTQMKAFLCLNEIKPS